MKNLSYLLVILAVIATSCKNNKKETKTVENETVETATEVTTSKKIKATLSAKSDSNVTGNIVFEEIDGKVNMVATISGLEPGIHAIHLHETADCSSPDGKSTGGHWNPTAQSHGAWGDETGFHKGDIGNLTADENGNATISFSTDQWCIGCGDETKDIIGKGVIVHAGADDFVTQPTGAAGGRVSCAGIIE